MTSNSTATHLHSWIHQLAIRACFVLSGVAALVYQIAWTRQFALVFGTSELAVAAVLAAYMGGLALGAYWINGRIRRVQRPVLWYAALELGIALAALVLVPLGLHSAEQLLIATFGGQAALPDASLNGPSLFYLLSAFLVLLIPTTLMGATLPLLVRHAVHREQDIGGIGALYAANTAGAVAGALLGSLWLLPWLGLMHTIWVAAAINMLVAALALLLGNTKTSRELDAESISADQITSSTRTSWRSVSPNWVLPLMLLSGAVSFLHEVLWTRMLGHVLGSSIYAFGIMLASFLLGIALGGSLGGSLINSVDDDADPQVARASAARWLAISELATAIAAIVAWLMITHLSNSVDTLSQRMRYGFLLLFPMAFAIGLSYPLAVRILTRDANAAASASARVYSWNTMGAILGSLAGGFFIVPMLRYEGAVHVAVIGSCVLACMACFLLFRPNKPFGWSIGASALVLSILFMPGAPDALLRYSSLRVDGSGQMLFYDVGRSAAVVVLRQGDQIAVRTNGLPEAAIDTVGGEPQLYVEAWMAPLAVLARPQLQDMLIVGLGGARVLEAVPPSVAHIDVVELEDKVIAANRSIAAVRMFDPLSDARVHFIVNDARGALQLSNKYYDAIVSQPSHPWTAGASHLYTREYMQAARAHLNPGGLFVQWMNVDFLDEPLLRSLLATLTSVYPHVRVYRPAPPTLLFLASDAPIDPEHDVVTTRAAFAAAPEHYARLGLNVVEDLAASLALDDQGSRDFAGGATPITDDANRFATVSVFDFGRNMNVDTLSRLLAPHDPLLHADNALMAWDYVARRIKSYAQYDSNAYQRLHELTAQQPPSDLHLYLQSLDLRGAAEQTDHLQSDGLKQYPNSELLHDAVLEHSLSTLNATENALALAALTIEANGQASDAALTVLHAVTFSAQSNWRELANLDDALARIPWTSLWSAHAIQLRATWRIHQAQQDKDVQLARQGIALLDRIGIVQPEAAIFMLRALGAQAANDPMAVVESVARYTALTSQATAAANPHIQGELQTLQTLLEPLQDEPRVNARRYDEVRTLLNQAVANLP